MTSQGMDTASDSGKDELPTSKESLPLRLELTHRAEMLALTDPWFGRAWRVLLSREGGMADIYEEADKASVDAAQDAADANASSGSGDFQTKSSWW